MKNKRIKILLFILFNFLLNKKVDTEDIIPALSGQLITNIIFFLDIFINTTNYFQNKQDWHLNSTLRIYT